VIFRRGEKKQTYCACDARIDKEKEKEKEKEKKSCILSLATKSSSHILFHATLPLPSSYLMR
jgi:hypothetical protein